MALLLRTFGLLAFLLLASSSCELVEGSNEVHTPLSQKISSKTSVKRALKKGNGKKTPAPSFYPSLDPTFQPSTKPSSFPSLRPSMTPPTTPSPTSEPSGGPSSLPSLRPTAGPSFSPSVRTLTADDICPKNRRYPPEKFSITPYTDSNINDAVEDDLNEVSYIAYSAQSDANGNRYAYMASDKEQYSLKVVQFTHHVVNPGNIFATGNHFNGNGTVVATYTLFSEEPMNDDWEDISLGPCSSDAAEQVCIYVGNIGNNNRSPKPQRKELYIYKFVEPTIGVNGPQDQTVQFSTIQYRYGDGFDQSAEKYYDAEAIFVDWTGVEGNANENPGDIYIVTKTGCSGGVGKIPVAEHTDLAHGEVLLDYSMARVVAYPPMQGQITCGDGPFRAWTGSDMRRDGRLIALIREGPPASVYFYPRTAGQSVSEALSIAPCEYMASTSYGLDNEKKHEGVAFVDPEGLRFADISECEGSCSPSLYQYELEYPDSIFPNISAPEDGWQDITYDNFENGEWGSYASGGQHAVLSSEADTQGGDTCNGNCACEGSWAAMLQEDRGEASSIFHSASHACESFAFLRVMFKFKFRDYDHLDTLFLEISLDGGLTYFIVGDWAHSVMEYPYYEEPLDRAICYTGQTLLYPSQFRVNSFGNNVKLRFRNSGNAANDRVYVDQILFEGNAGVDATVRRRR